MLARNLVHKDDNGNKRYLPFFIKCMKVSRCCESLTEFHMFWSMVFERADSWEEGQALKVFQAEYFWRVSTRDAARHYGCSNVPLSTKGVWMAGWWSGMDRIQPGFASGSQAQESWHKAVILRIFLDEDQCPLRRGTPEEVLRAMGNAVSTLGNEFRHQKTWHDTPHGVKAVDPVATSSTKLPSMGRTSAAAFFAKQDYIHKFQDAECRVKTFVMPLTFWGRPETPNDPPVALPDDDVRICAAKAEVLSRLAGETDRLGR